MKEKAGMILNIAAILLLAVLIVVNAAAGDVLWAVFWGVVLVLNVISLVLRIKQAKKNAENAKKKAAH